jgi:integrase
MAAMRPKTAAQDLPPRMLRRVKVLKSGKEWVGYYYNGRDDDGRRKEIPLGGDLVAAKIKWAELECQPTPSDVSSMRTLFDRYERDVMPTKAPRTRKDNAVELANLRLVFDSAPIDAVTPAHVAQYRDKRGAKAKTRANRELALLSHVFNMAREWGLRSHENPVRGVRKLKETPRSFYADDATWAAVRNMGSVDVQDAMDLAYLTGQRPGDVLRMRWNAIKDGALEVQQGKTGKRLRILLSDAGQKTELGIVLDRIRTRAGRAGSFFLVADAKGQPLKAATLRLHFDTARAAAADKHPQLAETIKKLWFVDARSKAASDIEGPHAQALLGHTNEQITETVYRRRGATVMPTR